MVGPQFGPLDVDRSSRPCHFMTKIPLFCSCDQPMEKKTRPEPCYTIEKSFPNRIKSNRNQFVFTIIRLIWNQTDVRLVPNHLENGKYNLISV